MHYTMSQPVEQGFVHYNLKMFTIQFKTAIILFQISNSSHVTSVYCFYLPCREVEEQKISSRKRCTKMI